MIQETLPDVSSLPRFRRSACVLGRESGIYALFLRPGSPELGVTPGKDGLLYIGKAEGAGGFADRCHFDGRTLNHSPRKSLAVLLKEDLHLDLQGHPPSKWGLTAASDATLTAWMKTHLLVAFLPWQEPSALEEALVKFHAPPLNLTLCRQGQDQVRLRNLRSVAKALALDVVVSCAMPEVRRIAQDVPLRARSDDSATSIAERYGLNPKSFRAALRRQKFLWHSHGASWDVARRSSDWKRMIEVAMAMSGLDLREIG